jgi:hypothetical protein
MITRYSVYKSLYEQSIVKGGVSLYDNTIDKDKELRTKEELDSIVSKYLHKWPELGVFDYRSYGWSVDFNESTFDNPIGSSTIHIVFLDSAGNDYVLYIRPPQNASPAQIDFASGPRNKNKFIHLSIQSLESLAANLRKIGVKVSSN